jgi:hypothetical protein
MAVVGTIAPAEQSRQLLIPGIQEPEEMRVEPFPTAKHDLTAPERMLGEALQKSDSRNPATLLPALNRILAQYPDFSDGYVMRAPVQRSGRLSWWWVRVALMLDDDSVCPFMQGEAKLAQDRDREIIRGIAERK